MRVTGRESERDRERQKNGDRAMESKVVLIKIPTEKDTADAVAVAAGNGVASRTQNILK